MQENSEHGENETNIGSIDRLEEQEEVNKRESSIRTE
jgi:hypothetical protein